MKPQLSLHALSIVCCLLCVLPCSAATPDMILQDQETKHLLNRVLHSEDGRRLTPASVIYVTPSAQAPDRLHRRIPANRIYLITNSQMFYSLYLTPNRVILEWQSRLVPKTDKTAMEPTGPLGKLLEILGERIPNHAALGKHGNGGTFLGDMDNPSPLVLYHFVKGRLIRDGE